MGSRVRDEISEVYGMENMQALNILVFILTDFSAFKINYCELHDWIFKRFFLYTVCRTL